jgi:adenylate cyclase
MMDLQSHNSFLPSREVISHQLERMLDSPDFRASPQQTDFLKFVVDQTLAGNANEIKGYTVATEVFGRRPDFDQSIDPVVSIQAARVRRALERYYLTAGQNDAVSVLETWPTVLVRPPANLTANPADDFVSIGLTTELSHALSHYREIRILQALHRNPESPPSEMGIDFVIDGSVRRDPAGITVALRLCDAKKRYQVWSGKYQGDLEAAKMIAFQEDVAAQVAVCVAGDNAAIAKHLAGESRNKAAPELTTYEAMLRYWESDTLLTPQSMLRAIRALEQAVAHEPEYGQTWSMLAAQYADNYGLEIADPATPLEKAAVFAQRGVSLDPTNRRARMILGHVRLLENKLREARYEAETAYNLGPNSLMVLDAIGSVMAMAGEWERGINWIKRAIKLNPSYRPRVRYPLCFNWFRLGNYEKAYRESLDFRMPELFWDPLLKASACGHLGRIEAGQASVGALLALKPDFARRGRILIGRYVKFEDIADRIIEGLGKLGMRIEGCNSCGPE